MPLRLNPASEIELRWYFLESASEFGVRSWLGPLLQRAAAGQLFITSTPSSVEPLTERSAAALRRARVIRSRLNAMGKRHASVLVAAYCDDMNRDLEKAGRLGNVALMTKAGTKAYNVAYAKALAKVRGEGVTLKKPLVMPSKSLWLARAIEIKSDLASSILTEADAMLTAAVIAWKKSSIR